MSQLTKSLLLAIALLVLPHLAKAKKTPKSLKLSYSESAYVNFANSFPLECHLVYSNGKTKEITGKDELSITVTGPATYSRGKIHVDGYPQQWTQHLIRVKATYQKDKFLFRDSLDIPFNYKGDIELDFSGVRGTSGKDGSKGSTPFLLRDGNNGDDGLIGGDGMPGDNLTVYIWKDSVDFYFVRINNLSSGKTYLYKLKDTGYGFRINVNGGPGGKGGSGGNGGDGKDGSVNNGKTKAPGDGGKGGKGGQGGTGGNGGEVYIFIHPSASSFQSKIAVYNYGGAGGEGGSGGKGGAGGAALEGQTAGSKGLDGLKGAIGYNGLNSTVLQILIEEFDIEY